MRALLIDDSSTARALHRLFLRKLGFSEILEAVDGRQALASFDANAVDVVLCDLHMPELGGLETVAELRRRAPLLPLFILSAEYDAEWARRARELGVTGWLPKPTSLAGLREALAAWVELRPPGGRMMRSDSSPPASVR